MHLAPAALDRHRAADRHGHRPGRVFLGYPFLTTHTAHVTLPLMGELHVASALFYDIGVFTLVVGATLLILTALGHQSVRGHRRPRSAAPVHPHRSPGERAV
jgi:multicomponent K+:H+ antiporter subunit A